MKRLIDLHYDDCAIGQVIASQTGHYGTIKNKLRLRDLKTNKYGPGFSLEWTPFDISLPSLILHKDCSNILVLARRIPSSVTITIVNGKIEIASGRNTVFTGNDLRTAMASFLDAFSPIEDTDDSNPKIFRNMRLGDIMRITPPRGPTIISASGIREGFPANTIGQSGTIVAFDPKTLSGNTVCLDISGHRYWGSHLELECADDLS